MPQLSVRRGRAAIDFYKAAFGAVEVYRVGGTDDHEDVVAQLAVGDASFWVSDESPPHGNFSPESVGGGTVRMLLVVEDPDAVVEQAIAAGAKEVYPVGDEHRWRLGRIEDPFGHHWEIGKPLVAWPPAGGAHAAAAVDVVRRFYAAVAEGDMESAAACFHEDGLWSLPGRGAIAGEHRGPGAIRDNVLAKIGPLSGGTFRAELIDVAVGGEHVVAVQHATAEHRGKRLDVTACQLIRVEDGKIVEMTGHYSDQYALDDFWS